MHTVDEQVLVGGQRAFAIVQQSGDMLYSGGATDVECIVKVDGNAQRAIKVVLVDGGTLMKNVIKTTEYMPQASLDTVGEIYLYNGGQSADYKHGYIYEGARIPANAESVTFATNAISCSGSDFWGFVKSNDFAPSDYADIVKGEMLFIGGDTWRLVGRNNNDEIVKTYQQYQLDWENIGFTFSGTFNEGDKITFICAINETSSDTYWWQRINVQP